MNHRPNIKAKTIKLLEHRKKNLHDLKISQTEPKKKKESNKKSTDQKNKTLIHWCVYSKLKASVLQTTPSVGNLQTRKKNV